MTALKKMLAKLSQEQKLKEQEVAPAHEVSRMEEVAKKELLPFLEDINEHLGGRGQLSFKVRLGDPRQVVIYLRLFWECANEIVFTLCGDLYGELHAGDKNKCLVQFWLKDVDWETKVAKSLFDIMKDKKFRYITQNPSDWSEGFVDF